MKLTTYLRLITGLKWTLTRRHFQRNMGSAVATLIGVSLTSLMLVGGLALAGVYLHTSGQHDRDAWLFWTLWVGTLLWAAAPLGQLDMQRNLDLTGLRLFPLTRLRFTLAVLLDGLLSPLSLMSVLGAVAILAGYTFSFGEALLLLPTLLLLAVFQLGCAQALS